MALSAVSCTDSPPKVKERSKLNRKDSLRRLSILGHDPEGIHIGGRSTAKRDISASWPLDTKQCLSRARFAVKWITNVFKNLIKEDVARASSFIV
jgi:hypothetical protein